jgi:predicted ATPase
MINKISFKNYKSFKKKQELELRPITVLIGKNSSGKSAISKLLTLFSASLSGEFEQPLRWENDGIKLGLSNSDLVYNKNTTTSLLEFGILSKSGLIELIVAIDRKDKPTIMEWKLNGELIDIQGNKFVGFLPEQHSLTDFKLNYDYIGPIRDIPKPNYSNSFEKFKIIGINGSNAYPILIQDYENEGEVLGRVSEWYKKNFEGWRIEVLPIAAPEPTFQVVLSNNTINQVNIVNMGQGMNQALPLIVRSFMKNDTEAYIIIEEPETHLHPAAHGNLAERFVDSYLEDNKRRYFIETHSQNFLLRMRRMVAQKKISPEDLAIYYVDFDEEVNESYIRRIEVIEGGDVNWWPDGIFMETLMETRAISNVQSKTSKDVD